MFRRVGPGVPEGRPRCSEAKPKQPLLHRIIWIKNNDCISNNTNLCGKRAILYSRTIGSYTYYDGRYGLFMKQPYSADTSTGFNDLQQ